ncbi:hypothetical protein GOBAR_AA07848 [Gossypium barbadense]|uniref:Transketolase N-terminal domain-containing protein n=1 Tax=Gossypium barbadense TaxID=3634 RepID=A0A2P5YB36_GOSBA|nr:hypothetical protein GOBAR_AA07848 [Gossypium barbadense]
MGKLPTPETPGVEVITGPLGQGIANAVGRIGSCGETLGSCSLPGHWGLGKLIALYDDNRISIDGDTLIAFTESIDKCFEGLGWHGAVKDLNCDCGRIFSRAAFIAVVDITDAIAVTTAIAQVDATRKYLGWPFEPFHVSEDVKGVAMLLRVLLLKLSGMPSLLNMRRSTKRKLQSSSQSSLVNYQLARRRHLRYTLESPTIATRNLPQQNLNALIKDTPKECNVRFGVKEHGMGAICNGITLHGPANGNKTVGAYKVVVLKRKTPSILSLSKKKLPLLVGTSIEGIENGGYFISSNSSGSNPDVILIRIARVSIKAESTFGWGKIVGSKGKAIGIGWFGASAPAKRI